MGALAAGPVYTLETWNFTFLDTELLLCLCEVNHVLYANFYRFSQDQALLATEFARGMDLLVEAVGRRVARGPGTRRSVRMRSLYCVA